MWCWSPTVEILTHVPIASVVQVCVQHPPPGKVICQFCSETQVLVLIAMIRSGVATAETVEQALAGAPNSEIAKHWPIDDEDFCRQVRGLGVSAKGVCSRQGIGSRELVVLRAVLGGDLALADIDLIAKGHATVVPELIREGVSLRWGKYRDGKEFMPLLNRLARFPDHQVGPILMALRAARVDLSRHHYCDGPDGCTCGYRPCVGLEGFLASAGAVACGRGCLA
jgi:hypothetical protein